MAACRRCWLTAYRISALFRSPLSIISLVLPLDCSSLQLAWALLRQLLFMSPSMRRLSNVSGGSRAAPTDRALVLARLASTLVPASVGSLQALAVSLATASAVGAALKFAHFRIAVVRMSRAGAAALCVAAPPVKRAADDAIVLRTTRCSARSTAAKKVAGAAAAQFAVVPSLPHRDTVVRGGAIAASASSPDSIVALFDASLPCSPIAPRAAPALSARSAAHADLDRWARWRPLAEPLAVRREAPGASMLLPLRTCAWTRALERPLTTPQRARTAHLPAKKSRAVSPLGSHSPGGAPRAADVELREVGASPGARCSASDACGNASGDAREPIDMSEASPAPRSAHWWTLYSPVLRPSSSGAASEPVHASHSLRPVLSAAPGPAPFLTSAATRSTGAPPSMRGGKHARRSRSALQTTGDEEGDVSKSLDVNFRQTVAADGARAAPADRLPAPASAVVSLQRTACWLAVRTVARVLAGRVVAASAPSSKCGAAGATKLFGSRVGGMTSSALSSWQSLSAVMLVEFVTYPIDTVGPPPLSSPSRTPLYPPVPSFSRSFIQRSPAPPHTPTCCSWPLHRRPLHLTQWRQRAMAFGTPSAESVAPDASASLPSRASRLVSALTTLSSLWDGWCWHIGVELLVGRAMQTIARTTSTFVAAGIMWPQWRALLHGIVARSWSATCQQQLRGMWDGASMAAITGWRRV